MNTLRYIMSSRLKWDKANQAEKVRDYGQRKKNLYSEVKPLTNEEAEAKLKELMTKRVKQLEDELDALAHYEHSEGD